MSRCVCISRQWLNVSTQCLDILYVSRQCLEMCKQCPNISSAWQWCCQRHHCIQQVTMIKMSWNMHFWSCDATGASVSITLCWQHHKWHHSIPQFKMIVITWNYFLVMWHHLHKHHMFLTALSMPSLHSLSQHKNFLVMWCNWYQHWMIIKIRCNITSLVRWHHWYHCWDVVVPITSIIAPLHLLVKKLKLGTMWETICLV